MKKIYSLGISAMALFAASAQAENPTFDEDGITFEGDNYKLVFGGRLHLDTVSVNDDLTMIPSESDIRRLRVNATLNLAENFRIKLDGDVGGTSTGWKNAWIQYRGIENVSIKAGQMIVPLNGEDMMSSNKLKLMERGLPSALAPAFGVGGLISYSGENWTVTGGYFGDPIDQDQVRSTDKGESVVGRIVVAPIKERKRALHLAGAIEHRELDSNEPSKISARPEFGLSGVSLIKVGPQPDVQAYTNYNFETGYMQGPFMVRGQYITRNNDAPAIGDPSFSGSTVETAYVLTGERQRYSSKSGSFGGVKPRGKYGAFEVAARYSTLDLSDAGVTGGEETNYAVGVNWYINENLRLMGNYVNADAKPNATGANESAEAIMGRLQIAY